VGFTTGAPYGSFRVMGATGSLPFTTGPSFNADRTQLTWSMTHSSLANAMDCVDAGPLNGDEYASASNPDSRYNANCQCWLDSFPMDRFEGDDHGNGTVAWFPGKVPPPSLRSVFSDYGYFMEGKPVDFWVYASGARARVGSPSSSGSRAPHWCRPTRPKSSRAVRMPCSPTPLQPRGRTEWNSATMAAWRQR
jgi:hypothetical protein